MYLNKKDLILKGRSKYLNLFDLGESYTTKEQEQWVAQLDGATQYWQLSETVNPFNLDNFELELSFYRSAESSSGSFILCFMSGNSYGLNLYATGNWSGGEGALAMFKSSGIPSIVGLSNETHYKINLRVLDGVITFSANEKVVQSSSFSLPPGFSTSTEGALGARPQGDFKFSGFIHGFKFFSSESLTNHIPLTNKAQGATQLATVGNVNAFMPNYTDAVWRKP